MQQQRILLQAKELHLVLARRNDLAIDHVRTGLHAVVPLILTINSHIQGIDLRMIIQQNMLVLTLVVFPVIRREILWG